MKHSILFKLSNAECHCGCAMLELQPECIRQALIPFVHVCFMQGTSKNKYAIVNGRSVRFDKVPTNIHGDKEFIVKLQAPVGALSSALLLATADPRPVLEAHGIGLTDQSRSFMAFVEVNGAGHKDLVNILVGVGRLGRMGGGRVAYVSARREGPKLKVFVEGLPDQQQVW